MDGETQHASTATAAAGDAGFFEEQLVSIEALVRSRGLAGYIERRRPVGEVLYNKLREGGSPHLDAPAVPWSGLPRRVQIVIESYAAMAPILIGAKRELDAIRAAELAPPPAPVAPPARAIEDTTFEQHDGIGDQDPERVKAMAFVARFEAMLADAGVPVKITVLGADDLGDGSAAGAPEAPIGVETAGEAAPRPRGRKAAAT